jgi:anaerobic magnesium-protoporphyrin IX monomethyl ester cyclase
MVGFKVRYRDPVLVADEIESILELGFERINIADDLFTANGKRVRAFCEEILRRQLVFGWSAFARVDTVDEETLKMMKSAGCDAVSFGIESGNPEMLKRVKKRITLDQARNAVKICKKVGMIAHASFMVGLPGETQATLKDTLDFARELEIEHGYHFLAPFPGTTVREHLPEYDLQILTNDWTRYDANKAIVRTSHLSPEEMENFVTKAYQSIIEQWENSKQRYAKGSCSDEDRLAVESEQRLKLIYHMLSNDIIEKVGRFKNNGNHPVKELGRLIAETTDIHEDFIYRYIQLWAEKNYLTYMDDNGRINWQWTPGVFSS